MRVVTDYICHVNMLKILPIDMWMRVKTSGYKNSTGMNRYIMQISLSSYIINKVLKKQHLKLTCIPVQGNYCQGGELF